MAASIPGSPGLLRRERKDCGTYYWYFRYYDDVIQPDGSVKTFRRFHTIGASRDKEHPMSRQRARD